MARVVRDFDEPPKVLRQRKPSYPDEAFRNRIEGTVDLEIVIDETGRVAHAKVTASIPALDAAALESVKHWRFEPARKDGQPVATIATAPVTFCIVECRPHSPK